MLESVEWFVCPRCSASIVAGDESLNCTSCGVRYDYNKNIPVFLQQEIFWSEPGISKETMETILGKLEKTEWHEVLSQHPSCSVRKHYYFISNLKRAKWHKILSLKKDAKILDLGAGMGTISHALSKFYSQVYAVEPVQVRCEFMRHRFRQENASNVTVIRADSSCLPFSDNFFDHILLNGVLEWLPYSYKDLNPREAQLLVLRKLFRLLKPGGSISIGIENRLNYAFLLGAPDCHIGLKYVTVLPRFIADVICRLKIGDRYRPYIYSWIGLKRMLAKSGFTDIEIYNSLPCYNDPQHTINLKLKSNLHGDYIWPAKNLISLLLKKVLDSLNVLKYMGYAFRAVGVKKADM